MTDITICHKCGASLPDVPGRGRARCSQRARNAQARREKEGRELSSSLYSTFKALRKVPAERTFRGEQRNAAAPKAPTLFDRPGLDAGEIEAGLSEYRASRVSAQSLAKRWGCEIEAVYASDVEFTRRMKRREREIA